MSPMKVVLTVLALVCSAVATQAVASAQQEPHSVAAVLAVENHWTQSEISGDVAYLDGMLMPGYRSVSSSGVAITKADILAHAVRNGKSNAVKLKVEAYLKAHPQGTAVTLEGDTAIVTFYSKRAGPIKGITSSDTFLYVNGAWRAWYSQHTDFSG
jgi:hypothetical protein